jgi:hypothetical protein
VPRAFRRVIFQFTKNVLMIQEFGLAYKLSQTIPVTSILYVQYSGQQHYQMIYWCGVRVCVCVCVRVGSFSDPTQVLGLDKWQTK